MKSLRVFTIAILMTVMFSALKAFGLISFESAVIGYLGLIWASIVERDM